MDNGVGIPQKTDWQTSDSLGLRIVRNLVESQLEGTIELSGNPGTCVTICFDVEITTP